MNMVIQSIKQLEAEYTTFTGIYDVMLSVKKGLKDRIKDKFYGFKVRQVLEKLSITQKKVLRRQQSKITSVRLRKNGLISRTAHLERSVVRACRKR
jgi:hypothetical protein